MELGAQQPVVHGTEGSLTRRQLFVAALGLGVGAVLTACRSETSRPQPEIEDCSKAPVHLERAALTNEGVNLANQEWHMPGIEKSHGRLRVSPSPITIMGKDGKDQPTLPFWPDRRFDAEALHVGGILQLDSPETKASLLFATELPTTYDDFQFPGNGVRVTVTDRSCTLEVWDGVHKGPKTESFDLPKRGLRKEIEVAKKDGKLQIMVDGHTVKELAGFTKNRSWLGLESSGGSYTVDELRVSSSDQAASVADMTSLQVAHCAEGLHALAGGKPCAIGTALALTPLLENPNYAAIVAGNFTSITTENALKPQFVHPEEGVYTFQEAERLVRFADRHNMQVHAHALLPNRSMPEWMRNLPTETDADKARVRQVMVDHITTIMEHFPTIRSFDVVNEALDGTGWRKDTIWYKAMGDDFINIAFAAAFKANPNALLFINDYSMDKAGSYDETRFTILLRKLRTIRKENPHASIGIGFEGHVYNTPDDCMSPNDLRRRMKSLMHHGMVTRVSEIDVTTHYNGSEHTTNRGLKLQAQQFGDIAKACVESPACVSFTMWGVGGKYVSTAGVNEKGQLTWGSNLPWDKYLKQRPLTYRALKNAFT